MIDLIIEDYLASLQSERELDQPFHLLLRAMGFESIQFTHGTTELGRDFIAQCRHSEGVIQYSFQLKKGRIGQAEYRRDVLGQILQSLTSPIQHPDFDPSLPHQVVLVTSGRLTAVANLALNSLSDDMVSRHGYLPIKVWDEGDLIHKFNEYGLAGLHGLTVGAVNGQAEYLRIYADALGGSIDVQRVEQYSLRWVDSDVEAKKWELWISLEAETLGRACAKSGLSYERIFILECRIRALLSRFYIERDRAEIIAAIKMSLPSLLAMMEAYCHAVLPIATEHGGLLKGGIRPTGFVAYPVHCSRIIETAGVLFHLAADREVKQLALQLLIEMVENEPGCAHPISDRYAVPIVLAVTALAEAGQAELAKQLINNTAVWVCDRYEHDFGLASVDATPSEEVHMLLGAQFENIAINKRKSSFTGSMLLYLAKHMEDVEMVENLNNDFEAVGIHCEYYCIPDSRAACRIDSDEIRLIPATHFTRSGPRETFLPAHRALEPSDYIFALEDGEPVFWLLATTMRDRVFPALWMGKSGLRRSNNEPMVSDNEYSKDLKP